MRRELVGMDWLDLIEGGEGKRTESGGERETGRSTSDDDDIVLLDLDGARAGCERRLLRC